MQLSLRLRMSLLQLTDLSFDYQDLPLLQHVNFDLNEGDLIHIHGANGAGKTTLLKLLAGLYQPSSGLIRYKNTLIDEDLFAYQNNLCLVGHKTGISPYLSIKENCLFDAHYPQHYPIDELVSVFNLEPYLNSPCSLLSAGQKRQVALLRLWMTQAQIWLLDEPFVALDEQAVVILLNKLSAHRQQGGAIILTSHQALPLNKGSYKDVYL